jgi:hypothetical protein
MKLSNNKTPLDRASLNLDDESATKHWTKEWGVTKTDLQRAIDKVGPAIHAVAKELGKSQEGPTVASEPPLARI